MQLDDTEVAGLLALMLLTGARRLARASVDGELIPLTKQDRTLRRHKQTEARAWGARPTFAVPVLLSIVAAAASGCGGGGGYSAPPPAVNTGTPPGTYTLTVTVVAPSSLTHAQQLTLIVQ